MQRCRMSLLWLPTLSLPGDFPLETDTWGFQLLSIKSIPCIPHCCILVSLNKTRWYSLSETRLLTIQSVCPFHTKSYTCILIALLAALLIQAKEIGACASGLKGKSLYLRFNSVIKESLSNIRLENYAILNWSSVKQKMATLWHILRPFLQFALYRRFHKLSFS